MRFSITSQEIFADHTDADLVEYVGMDIASNTSRYRKLVSGTNHHVYGFWSQKCHG